MLALINSFRIYDKFGIELFLLSKILLILKKQQNNIYQLFEILNLNSIS